MTADFTARSRKLHPRYTPFVFAFFMAGIMGLLMSSVIVAASSGIDASFPNRVIEAYVLAAPVAFFCVLLVRPVVARIVSLIVRSC
ncbi:DUF2798 domain-containing protein [Rhizobium sp. CFBP 8762]|uniref:DUF2798 domain-containing protein n=1 Tax=Rhizobium sp. CFBP 8762 TaxID=2775279 RepID=UPI00177FC537|nr:DUF2798 domain-containing protein [Rhizobium sp. CFBP 8762]MBD8553203.1 DUF2798 domain-containing protein [Rhizobium sp. CFBP 8762]